MENYNSTPAPKWPGEKSPVVQWFDYDCGAAAVRTILGLVGRQDPPHEVLMRVLGTTPEYGTPSRNIAHFLEGEGVDLIEIHGSSVEDMRGLTDRGWVCLVAFQANGSEEDYENRESGHYSVVWATDKNYVWMADPAVEESEWGWGINREDREDFERRWIDEDGEGLLYYRWMLAARVK